MIKTCVQCKEPADLHVKWLATEGPVQANLCSCCLGILWTKFSNTTFGQTIQIEPS